MAKTTFAQQMVAAQSKTNGRSPRVDTAMKNCRENETFRLELAIKMMAEFPDLFKGQGGRREKTEGTGIQLLPQEKDGQLDIDTRNGRQNVNYLTLDAEGAPAKPVAELDVLIRKYSVKKDADGNNLWNSPLPKYGWAPSKQFEGNSQIPGLVNHPKYKGGRRYMAFDNFVRLVQEWEEDTEQDYVDFDGLNPDSL